MIELIREAFRKNMEEGMNELLGVIAQDIRDELVTCKNCSACYAAEKAARIVEDYK